MLNLLALKKVQLKDSIFIYKFIFFRLKENEGIETPDGQSKTTLENKLAMCAIRQQWG